MQLYLTKPRITEDDIKRLFSVRNLSGERQQENLKIHENGNLSVEIDLPGVRKEDVKLSVENRRHARGNFGVLVSYKRNEKVGSTFVYISDEFSMENIVAKLDLGVLSLTFNKSTTNASKTIELT